MTSKEVEKMKNEEVLEILLGNVDYKDYSSETMRLVNSCVSRLWEILERLEMLESNSDKVIKDSVKLINKNLELQARLEVLEQSNNILNKLSNNQHETITNLTEENEKLKKAIEILKDKLILGDAGTEFNYCFVTLTHDWCRLTDEEYELLKEVLK